MDNPKHTPEQLHHIAEVKRIVESGDLLTYTVCLGIVHEAWFDDFDGQWLAGTITDVTRIVCDEVCAFVNDIAPINVTHINRVPVGDIADHEANGWWRRIRPSRETRTADNTVGDDAGDREIDF